MNTSIQITLNDELLNELTGAIKEAVKEELPKHRDSFRKDWLSTEEVMEMLNVSRRTVQNYRDEGKIPYTQNGRKILYPRKGIEEFLRKNMIKAYR
ncbi:MAG: helix-turn-helix domain-containing protein [Balneolaceae bacterium]|nr:helix-turn-helix domain-containing protein [Balneolaceae bacterium]